MYLYEYNMSCCQLCTYSMMNTYHTQNMCAILYMYMVMGGWWWGWWCIEFPLPPKGGSQIQYKWCGALSTPRQPPNQSPLLRPKVKEGQQLVMMIGWLMLMWWWVWCVSHKMAAYIKGTLVWNGCRHTRNTSVDNEVMTTNTTDISWIWWWCGLARGYHFWSYLSFLKKDGSKTVLQQMHNLLMWLMSEAHCARYHRHTQTFTHRHIWRHRHRERDTHRRTQTHTKRHRQIHT